jgi:formate hydrogenlyase transcriptional activator
MSVRTVKSCGCEPMDPFCQDARPVVVVIEDITERKRLWADLQRQNDRLRALLDLTHKLIVKLDASSAVESVLAVVQQHESWEVAEILLPDSSADRLKVSRHGGSKTLPSDGRTIPIDSSISGQVYRRGQRFLLRSEDLPVLSTRYGIAAWARDALNEAGITSGCFLPLIHDGRVIGVMVLGTSGAREVTTAEIDYLQEVAQFVAAVLDNALRFDALNTSQKRLASERHYTDEELRTVFDFEHIVGRSKAVRAVLQQVQTVAPTDSDVLVLGETGTGKELVARAIHDRSPRKDQPFIKLDCAAIPATLIESELFGHEKGAFTGAIS